MSFTREDVVSHARSWIGAPFRHQGRSKTRGVDCVGLILGVAQELGVQLIAPKDYTSSPSGQLVMQYANDQLSQTSSKNIGSVVVMWGFDRDEPQHLGFIGRDAGRFTLIHAFSKRGIVVEHGFDAFWDRRIKAFFELPGVID